MKAFSRTTLLFFSIVLLSATGLMAQRVIEGTVYMDGKPAPGITVEANKGGSAFTDFDGKYKVEADTKTKWLRFTSADGTSKKVELDENSGDHLDCALTGEIPSGDKDNEGSGVNLKSHDELIQAGNKDYMNQFSLYTEFYKQDDIKSAYPHWKIIYDKYPASSVNVYIHGTKIYEYLIEHAKTDEEKDKLLDDMMKMYDKRIKYFGEKGFVLGRKAISLLEYNITKRTNPLEGQALTEVLKKAYEWLDTSVSEQGAKAELPTLVLLMNTSISLFRLGELPKETVVKNYERCNTILTEIIANDKDPDIVKSAKEEVQPYIETKFGESGAADCEALVNIYTPQFEEKQNDAEFIKSMLRKLIKAKCDNSELVEKATVRLYDLEPSAEAAFNLAHSYYLKDDIENAKKYYRQAIDQEKDPKLLATYYYEYGALLYGKDKNFQEAREMERKAISLDPTLCKAYMLIGDIYVATSRTFSDDDFEKATVFWVAVDYYNKARAYDECAVDAAGKISEYKKYFPNKEEAFMKTLQEGASYKVGGWINETTKVRFSN